MPWPSLGVQGALAHRARARPGQFRGTGHPLSQAGHGVQLWLVVLAGGGPGRAGPGDGHGVSVGEPPRREACPCYPGGMNWSTLLPALLGGLIGAGIPGFLTGLGMLRARQAADAEAFGPAVLLLDRVNPYRVAMNMSPDPTVEGEKWAGLQRQLDVARERLLVVSAGSPRRHVRELARLAEVGITNAHQASRWVVQDRLAKTDNPEGMARAVQVHAKAETAMEHLISANFGSRRPLRALILQRRRALGRAAAEVPQQREGPAPSG